MPSENQKRTAVVLSITVPFDHISDNQNRSQKWTGDYFPVPQKITELERGGTPGVLSQDLGSKPNHIIKTVPQFFLGETFNLVRLGVSNACEGFVHSLGLDHT